MTGCGCEKYKKVTSEQEQTKVRFMNKIINRPPILVYLSYKFSGNPTKNTERARDMSMKLMKKHPDWFVFCPHYSIDALLDGKVIWEEKDKEVWDKDDAWRRFQAGYMSAGFLLRCDIMVLGCEPIYSESHGVTWETIIANVINVSYRRNNPIEIITYKEAMEIEK